MSRESSGIPVLHGREDVNENIYEENLVDLCYKIDVEGLSYALINGYVIPARFMDDDPDLANALTVAKEAIVHLENLLTDRRDQYKIEEA